MPQSNPLAHEARFLHRLALEVGAVDDLTELAACGVRAVEQLIPGRGVHLQIWDDDAAGGVVEADAGPEMSNELHRVALDVGTRRFGELVVDGEALDAAGIEHTPLEGDARASSVVVTDPEGHRLEFSYASEPRQGDRGPAPSA